MLTLRDLDDSPVSRAELERVYRVFLQELSGSHVVDAEWNRAGESHALSEWILLVQDGEIVGFARVQHLALDRHELAEFFVMPTWRRRGVGRAAARLLFDRFVGRWTLSVIDARSTAGRFWRSTLARYACDRFTERVDAGALRFDFVTPSKEAR